MPCRYMVLLGSYKQTGTQGSEISFWSQSLSVLRPELQLGVNHFTCYFQSTDLLLKKKKSQLNISNTAVDFSGGPVVKNPPANAGNAGSIPSPGRPHMPYSS